MPPTVRKVSGSPCFLPEHIPFLPALPSRQQVSSCLSLTLSLTWCRQLRKLSILGIFYSLLVGPCRSSRLRISLLLRGSSLLIFTWSLTKFLSID